MKIRWHNNKPKKNILLWSEDSSVKNFVVAGKVQLLNIRVLSENLRLKAFVVTMDGGSADGKCAFCGNLKSESKLGRNNGSRN